MTPPPTTVLYVAWAPFLSGAEWALLRLLDGLDRTRYRPVVAVGTAGPFAEEVRTRNVQTFTVPVVYTGARQLPAWSACISRLTWLAWRERAKILHSNDVPSFQPAGYAARLLGIPSVVHVRFPDNDQGFRWFLKPGFTRALFVSEALRREATASAPKLFDGRSEVVYDGVPVPPPADANARARLRADLGLPKDGALVVLAGQVAEVKGLWDFIEAAQILASREVPVSFVILGDDLRNHGALRIKAEQDVEARGLAARIRFLGFRPNAAALIPAFDIVAVPSHVEPLGNATLEAMAAGLPVVGSRVGGIPEMIVDGQTGSLVPSRDPVRLADAIEGLVRDPARARELGRAGRARALERFAVPAHASTVQAIYDDVLGVESRTSRESPVS